jgi:hypothetical protein
MVGHVPDRYKDWLWTLITPLLREVGKEDSLVVHFFAGIEGSFLNVI